MKNEGHSRPFEIISVCVFEAHVFASPHEREHFHELCFHAFLESALVTDVDLCEVWPRLILLKNIMLIYFRMDGAFSEVFIADLIESLVQLKLVWKFKRPSYLYLSK